MTPRAERRSVPALVTPGSKLSISTTASQIRKATSDTSPGPRTHPQLIRNDGKPVQKSVFSPEYRADFNSDEAEFACYIDEVAPGEMTPAGFVPAEA